MPLLTTSDLSVSYAEIDVFEGVSLEVAERSRVGVVGANGQGKTTLLEALVGAIAPRRGSTRRRRGLTIGYVPQTTRNMDAATLRDEVVKGCEEATRLEAELADSAAAIQSAGAEERRRAEGRYANLLEATEAAGGYDYERRLERVAGGIGLDADALATRVEDASGGQRTRASLAKALLAEPDLLLLDEPTNYLDFEGLSWLEGFLKRSTRAFVVVSHDRYFLDQTVTEIWELAGGRLAPFRGNYSKYRHLKAERDRRRQTEYARQRQYIAKQREFIERYRAGQRSREALGREKRLNRLATLEGVAAERGISIGAPSASRTGRVVLATSGLEVGFRQQGVNLPLLRVDDLALERGSRTAIIGPNGSGKTTFLQTVLGATPPLAGASALGHNVRVGFQRQGGHDLPEGRSALDAVLDVKNMPPEDARSYLGRFLFEGDDVFKRVSVLSGGERTRLALARLLLSSPNFLILDEPTTHLDIAAREALEQALLQYDGALLFVSHDRALISLLATRLLVVERGRLSLFDAPFAEWAKTREESAVRAVVRQGKKGRSKGSPASRSRRGAADAAAPRAGPPEYESVIAGLETRLARVEKGLQTATLARDVESIAKLGEEYNELQRELDAAWERWTA